jgi:ankyrin repeat protein
MPPPRTASWRPLFDACFAGDSEKVVRILAKGADPNQVARSGWRQRPLHRTCEFRVSQPKHEGHVECVRLLLEAGADPAIRANATNMRPLELAAIAEMPEAMELLKHPKLDVFEAAAAADIRRLAAILKSDQGAATACDDAGCTALWYVAAARPRPNRIEAAEMLLDAGADPNAFGIGVPLLHMAVGHSRNYELGEYLLMRGADLHVNTSLVHSSCSWHFQFLLEALDWFAAHRADFSLRDPETRQTARQRAEVMRYSRVVRRLP